MEMYCKICGEKTKPVVIEGKDVYSTLCERCFINKCRNKLD